MKSLLRKFVVMCLAFSMVLSTGVFSNLNIAFASEQSSYVIDAEAKGTTFSEQTYFQTKKGLSALPHTFEAVIAIPEGFGTARAGCIFSNFHNKDDAAISFELNTGGYPRLYLKNESDTGVTDITFSNVVVTNDNYDGYFHLAITIDDSTNTAKCYVNGVLKETKTYAKDYADLGITLANLPFGEENGAFRIGNDFRPSSAQYFKGSIKSVAVYSGVKNSFNPNAIALNSNLICAYDLSDVSELGEDLSSNDNDCIFRGYATFALDDLYVVDKKLDEKPRTFEAWVKMPSTLPFNEHPKEDATATTRGGVIIGNYKYGGESALSIEVTNKGEPRFFFIDSTTSAMKSPVTKSIIFTNSSSKLLKDEWTHLAITFDNVSGVVKCYINGTLTETKTGCTTDYHDDFAFNKFIVGNDYRGMYSFKGAIKNVAMYSDVRTQAEISSDMLAQNLADANLIASIKTTKMGKTFIDESGNGYDAKYSTIWLDEKEPVTDYAYSIAVVGDTQIDNMYDVRNGTTIMKNMYKWIADNADDKKIVQVLGLGDITESSSKPTVENERQKEWQYAKESISQLDGIVEYSLVRGNHDVISDFESTFGTYTPYTSQFDGFYEGSILNSYKLFTAGGEDYLLLTLDYGASDAMLEWAGNICQAYPDRKVIVTTHAYLYRDGTTLGTGDVCEPAASTDKNTSFDSSTSRDYNNGEEIWQGFLKKYSNIFMVLSGHDPSIEVIYSQAIGDNGNTVTQFLVDPQGIDNSAPLQGTVEGPYGMVTMLYFSADGKQIDVETYSTRYDAYHMATNQFTIDLGCTQHVYDQMLESDEYLKETATCTHGNIYYKSCKCGAVGEDTFEVGTGSHDYVLESTVAPNWSEQQDGYEIWVCSRDASHNFRKPIEWETLSATVIITNGTFNGESVAVVEIGSSVTVVANTIDGERFVKWMVNGNVVSTDNEYTFTIDAKEVSIIACFEDDTPVVDPDAPNAPDNPSNPDNPGAGDSSGGTSSDGGSASAINCQMAINSVAGGLMPVSLVSLFAVAMVLIKRKKASKNR